MFDDDNKSYDDEIKEVIQRYEQMLHDGTSAYFDSEEFGMIIDHYTQQDAIDKARHAVDLAMSQHPCDNSLKIKQARQYLLENDPEEALRILKHAERDDDDPDFFLTLGSCLAALGRYQKAIGTYMAALPYFDEDEKSELYQAIALEYSHMEQFDKAIEFYKKAIDIVQGTTQKSQIYIEMQSCFFMAGMEEKAIAYFQGLVDKNPYDSKAWTAIGDCYRMMSRYEDAIDPYEFSLSIDPKDFWTNLNLSNIYYDLERYKEAIDTLTEAIRNGLNASNIYASLGDCHYRLGDLSTAEAAYRKALKIAPTLGNGWAGLGYVFSDRNESLNAIACFEKAYQAEPFETNYLYSIAAEYHKLEDFDRSMEYLNKIKEQDPGDPDAYFFIADLYGELDHVDDAIAILRQGIQNTNSDPSLLYFLAYAYFVNEDNDNGLTALDLALEADFEGYHEFIEYDKELLGNNIDIIDMIASHKQKRKN